VHNLVPPSTSPFANLEVRDWLCWLPVQQRIEYKVCVLVYKCPHQAAPSYLAELCSPVSESVSRGHFRSAAQGDLAVPLSRTTRYGERCFAVSGPTFWNSHPLSVRDPSLTLTQFCAHLKTALFCRAYKTLAQCLRDSLGCKDCYANTNSVTYLLTCKVAFFLAVGGVLDSGPHWWLHWFICISADLGHTSYE